MQFLSKFKNHKKILVFVFLFLIVTGAVLPSFAQAASGWDWGAFWSGMLTGTSLGTVGVASVVSNTDPTCENNLSWYAQFTAGLVDVVLYIPKLLASFATGLADIIITKMFSWPITSANSGGDGSGAAAAFAAGWARVRDLANMLIVLGLIFVGIATALRIREYEAKNFLWKLIIVALFVNFSSLFCGLVIDASNILMKGLLPSNTGGMGSTMVTHITTLWDAGTCRALTSGSLTNYIISDVMFSFIYWAVAIAFLYFSIIMIARYAILGILFILSPIAFVFWAFPLPKVKDIWNKWWENFIKWAFVGVSVCFFLSLANDILGQFQISWGNTTSSSITNASDLFLYLLVVLMIVVVGIRISSKQNGIASMASTAVMGLVTGGAGLAMGAVAGAAKAGGKGLDSATGGYASRGANKISNATNRVMESFGFKQRGSTAGAAEQEIDKKRGAIANLSLDEQARIAGTTAGTHNARQDKIAAIQNLVKTNNLDKLGNEDKQRAALTEVESYEKGLGYSSNIRKEASKANPNLAENSIELSKAVRKTSAEKAAEWHPDVITPEVLSNMSKNQFDTINRKGSPGLISKIEQFGTPGTNEHRAFGIYVKNNPSQVQGAMENLRYIQGQGALTPNITSSPRGGGMDMGALSRYSQQQKMTNKYVVDDKGNPLLDAQGNPLEKPKPRSEQKPISPDDDEIKLQS